MGHSGSLPPAPVDVLVDAIAPPAPPLLPVELAVDDAPLLLPVELAVDEAPPLFPLELAVDEAPPLLPVELALDAPPFPVDALEEAWVDPPLLALLDATLEAPPALLVLLGEPPPLELEDVGPEVLLSDGVVSVGLLEQAAIADAAIAAIKTSTVVCWGRRTRI
jgi:hypothetical protein